IETITNSMISSSSSNNKYARSNNQLGTFQLSSKVNKFVMVSAGIESGNMISTILFAPGSSFASDSSYSYKTHEERSLKKRSFSIGFLNPEKSDRKSTRLNSSHVSISYAVFCLKKKNI